MDLEGIKLASYKVGPLLGRGGMGTVYRAETLNESPVGPAGALVAIKFFHPHLVEDERSVRRFRKEAAIGQSIRHNNVVQSYELSSEEVDGEQHTFMAMQFVEGQSLRALIAELGTLPEHLLYQVADQALDALAAIHEHGIIHRDIKPENLVITKDHKVLVMDLGIARQQDQATQLTQAGEFVGSLHYAAPEQIFEHDKVGPRADIYAVGVTMYEMATGTKPFVSEDLSALLNLKLKGDFRRPKLVNSDIDAFLDDVICTCLEKDITARFSTCAELRQILQDGEESTWWRQRIKGRPAPTGERALKRLRLPREAPLVGRGDEIDQLQAAYAEVQAGNGRIVLLGGATGSGKSRLAYSFVEEIAASEGPTIVAGRSVGSGGRAYQPFLDAMHDLLAIDEIEAGKGREKVEERLEELLPDTPGVVSPFAEFLFGGLQPGRESGFSQDALIASYANVLRHSSEARPVVLLMEDLHLAGPETVALFGHIARCLASPRILLIGVYRDDEIADDSDVQRMMVDIANRPETSTLVLQPLPRTATEELLRVVVRHERTVRRLGRLVHEKSDGNPLIIFEMLAHLRDTGALVEEEEGYTLTKHLTDLELPSTVRDLVSLKLGRLDDDERETLDAAAILGFEFTASLLAAVLEEKRIKLLKRLAILERKFRLIRSSGKNAFQFGTPQLYQAIYEGINPSLRAEYHSVAADAIHEAYEGEDPLRGEVAYPLVQHLLLAERYEESEPYADVASAHVSANYHASNVAPFLDQLSEALEGQNPKTRFAVRFRQWHCYDALGARTEQVAVLENGRELAEQLDDPALRGRVHSLLAVTHWQMGDYKTAAEEAAKGLELAREASDRTWEANSLHTLGMVEYRKGHYEQSREYARETLAIRRDTGDRNGEARSLASLGSAQQKIGENEKALVTKKECLEIFRELGDRRNQPIALSNVGNALLVLSRLEEAIPYYNEAVEIAREFGDLAGEGYPLLNLGRANTALGRVSRSKAAFTSALAAFAEAGVRFGELSVLKAMGDALYTFGDHLGARQHFESALTVAKNIGARADQCEIESALALVLHSMKERRQAWEKFKHAAKLAEAIKSVRTQASILQAMGSAALDEKDYTSAIDYLERSLNALGDAEETDKMVVIALCRLARAHHGAGNKEEAEKIARRAEKSVNGQPEVSPEDGPEIYFTFRMIFDDEDAGLRYLGTARDLVASRTEEIRDEAYREYYLTQTWPTREIVEEARKTLGR